MRVRRSYHINNDLIVRESSKCDKLDVIVAGSTTSITEEQWKALCDLRYSVHFEDPLIVEGV